MKKTLFILVCAFLPLFAEVQKVEISSDRFEAKSSERVAKFFENVEIRRGKDVIKGEVAYIFFNKQRKPIRLQVVKNVRFTLHHDNKRYQGRCEELIYFPKRREYVLKKDVFVHQLPDEKKIYAQSIVLALGQGRIDVKGKERQPVKMILRLEEQNATTH